MTDDGPGSLVEVNPLQPVLRLQDANASAVRIAYKSTSGDGQPTVVTGVVAVPPGAPPRDGWPVISFGHGLTGVTNICAPSLADDLWGWAWPVSVLISRGYMVAMSDYQGLGIQGSQHSLLDATALSNNMIDIVRAARRVTPDASTRWAAFGTGEGGLASWAAAERSGVYGGGLEMVGGVSLSPFADLSGLVDEAERGTLDPSQTVLYARMLQSVANTAPDFDLDLYRSGVAKDRWDTLIDCAPRDPEAAKNVLRQVRPADLRPRNPGVATELRLWLSKAALPQTPAPGGAPVLVIFASDDPLIPSVSTQRALGRACAKGDQIEIMRRVGDTNTNNDGAIKASISWLQSRFDGVPPLDVCVGSR
jgi:alpha-beta hydrolase superfamily lysophospholipase